MFEIIWRWLRPLFALIMLGILLLNPGLFVLFSAFAGIVLLAWIFVRAAAENRQQRARDKAAEEAVRSDDAAGFVLYLRPFNRALYAHLDTKLSEVFSSTWLSGGKAVKQVKTVEEQLVEVLDVPVVGVGSRRKESRRSPGYAQVTDEEWQERVESMMRRSGAIVIVPWGTEGTQWEVGKIAQDPNLLAKTVFLMPNFHAEYIYRMLPMLRTFAAASKFLGGTFEIKPNSVIGASFLLVGKALWRIASLVLAILEILFAGILFVSSVFVKSDLSGKWAETKRKSQGFGLSLPAYTSKGASFVYRVDESGQNVDMFHLTSKSVAELVASILSRSTAEPVESTATCDLAAKQPALREKPVYLVRSKMFRK